MTDWLMLAAYVAGFLFTYRRAYLALAASDEQRPYGGRVPDTEDRAMNAVFSMLVAMLWPVAIVGYGIWRHATPVTPGERKRELDAREREIERLERELGIEKEGR